MSLTNDNQKIANAVHKRIKAYKMLKLLLPLVAAVLLFIVLLWPNISAYFATKPQIIIAGSSDMTEIPKDENAAIKPQYEGVDKKGQPYQLSAQKGINIAPGIINLEHPIAIQQLKNGHKITITALKGTVFEDEKRLLLVGSVVFNYSVGIDFTSKSATILYSEGRAEGNENIYGVGHGFNIKAGSFKVYDNGKHIVFHNNPILTLER